VAVVWPCGPGGDPARPHRWWPPPSAGCHASCSSSSSSPIAAGTATTGAGPHAGGKGGQAHPGPLADMARTHAEIVLVLGVLTLAMLYLLDRTRAPSGWPAGAGSSWS